MIDQYFRSKHVRKRLCTGALGLHADALVVHLHKRGHRPSTVQTYMQAAEHFATWLSGRGMALEAADADLVSRFLKRHLPRCRCPTPAPRRLRGMGAPLRHLLTVLGVARSRAAIVPPTMATLIGSYEAHLLGACGLSPQTCRYRLRYAREFLAACFGDDPIDTAALTTADVRGFVLERAAHSKPGSAQVLASALRCFLRFLQLRGQACPSLVHAVPSVAHWRLAELPRTLDVTEIRRLLAVFDQSTPTGRRDYAMALCLTELGLRASEIPTLTLDDVHWRAGMLGVAAGKGRQAHLLPLPARVARALATYVRRGRPATCDRHLFLRHTPPIDSPVSCSLVRGVIRRGYDRAQLDAGTGTHILRRTAATRLLHAGASVKVIADLLRHRSFDTTAIYAKVDLPRLRAVALPWPEGWS